MPNQNFPNANQPDPREELSSRILGQFFEDFAIDPNNYIGRDDDYYWMELFWHLAVGYHFQLLEPSYIRQVIDNFNQLDIKAKQVQINQLDVFLTQKLNQLKLFYDVYGDKLEEDMLTMMYESLPDSKSKLEFLFMLATGLTPDEDPLRFQQFIINNLYEFDPEFYTQERLRQVFFDNRNRLHLGTLEDRQQRVVTAVDLQNYLNSRRGRSVSDVQLTRVNPNNNQTRPNVGN
jgi:hypothetical protein